MNSSHEETKKNDLQYEHKIRGRFYYKIAFSNINRRTLRWQNKFIVKVKKFKINIDIQKMYSQNHRKVR